MGKIIWTAAAALLLAVFITIVFAWRRPLAVAAWMNRRELTKAGFVQTTVNTSVGPQTVFEAGSGPTLVFLHGAGDQAGTWSKSAPGFTNRYHVLVLDLPGHGDSAPASGPLSVGTILQGVEGVIAQRAPGKPTLVGNSLGAWIALLYAYRHPGGVNRLVIADGGALMGDRPDLTLTPENREQARTLFRNIMDPGNLSLVPDYVLDDVVRQAQRGPLKRMAATAADMPQYLLDGRLRQVQAPVDMIWGEADQLFSLDYAHRMEAQLPASRIRTLKRCGHVPQVECPKAFTSALTETLDSPPPVPNAAVVQKEAGK